MRQQFQRAATLLIVSVAHCSDGPAVVLDDHGPAIEAPVRWTCPVDWVPMATGGCGPAVVACLAGGGAADHACDVVYLTRPTERANGWSMFRLPDGRVGGGWSLREMALAGPVVRSP